MRARIMSETAVEHALGYTGMFLAFVLFLSPIPTIKNIIELKDSRNFSCDPYISGLLNCGLWVIYALPMVTPNRTEPDVTNLIGLLFQVFFCATFLLFPSSTQSADVHDAFRRKLLASFVFLAFMLIVAFLFYDKPSDSSGFLGTVASILNVIMYAAPLSVMKQVWRTQSVEFMPLPLSVATFFCSFAWMLYGFQVNDGPIIFCNVAGVLLGGAQLLLYFYVAKIGRGTGANDEYSPIISDNDTLDDGDYLGDDNALDDSHAIL